MIMFSAEDARRVLSNALKNTDVKDLGVDTKFGDVGIDSLDQASILLEVQEEASVEIPDEDVDQCDTLNNLAAVVNKHLSK